VDWTFRAGDLIPALSFGVAGLSIVFAMKSDIRTLALELSFLKKTVEEQKEKIDSLLELTRLKELFSERMNNMDSRYHDRMSHIQRELDDLKGRRREGHSSA